MIIYDADITGSLKVNGSDFNLPSISSSIVTNSSSIASLESVSGSYANSASFASDISTNSSSIASLEAISGSYANSASFASDISTNSASIASLEIVSGSYANSSSFASDISANSASIGSLNAVSSSYLLNTTDTLTGDLTVTGNIIATTLNVQDVTASVVYSSGSNIFGSSSIDTQQFTGSILTSGSIEVNGDKFTVSGATGDATFAGTINSGDITSTGNSTFAGTVLINKASNPTYLQIGSSLTDDPFIVFQTDGNTMSMGIDRSDSNVFKISDNSTLGDARLVISNAGNVAINYTAPDGYGTLTVNGTSALPILALRSESGKVRQGFFEGGAGRFFLDTLNGSSGLSFVDGNSNTEKMRIDSSGGVSITPTTSTSFFYGADGTNSYINFETNNIDATVQLYAGYSSGGYFAIGTKDSGGTLSERMRVDGSGKILLSNSSYNFIGTNTSDGSNTQRIYIGAGNDATANQGGLISVYGNEQASTSEQGQVSLIAGRKATGNIRFWTGEASSVERMRIDSSGRVGIGVTPSYANVPLHTKRLGGGDAFNLFEGDSAWVFGEVEVTGAKYCQIAGRYGSHSGINVTTAGDVKIGGYDVENPASINRVLEISAAAPTGLILNDTRDAHPITIANQGAVLNFIYNTTNLITADGASGKVGINEAGPRTKLEIKVDTSSRTTVTRALTLNANGVGISPYEFFGTGIIFEGYDYGNITRDYAYIDSVMTSSGSGSNDFKSALYFYTNTGGSSSTLPTKKMVIASDGSLGRNSKKVWNFTAVKSFTEGGSSDNFFRLNFTGNNAVLVNITLMSNNSATGGRTMQSVQAMLSASYQGYLPTMTEITKTAVSNNGSSYISAVQGANGSLTFLCDTTNNTTGTSNTTFVSVELICNGGIDATITVL